MKNSVRAALAAVVLVLSTLTLQTPASAAAITITDSCSKSGFTGWVRVTYTRATRTVHRVEYKINKGDNKGGNSANVYWWDGGLLPALTASTGSGIQDNKWHVLREKNYTRGSGGSSMKFDFDRSLQTDPECGISSIF